MPDAGQMGRNAKLMTGFIEALNSAEMDRLGDYLTSEVTIDWPQSGERVRGLSNLRNILIGYPGRDEAGFHSETVMLAGEEPHYVMTPTLNLVRVHGSGDNPVLVARIRYPDGSTWYMIAFNVIRDEKIAHQTAYFAPEYPAPGWREQWVERLA